MPRISRTRASSTAERMILLFEDDQDQADKRMQQLKQATKGKIEIRRFTMDAYATASLTKAVGAKGAGRQDIAHDNFVAQVEKFVGTKDVYSRVGLIIADQELSGYQNLRPASGETILAYCKGSGIPICMYERNTDSPTMLSISKWKKWAKNNVIFRDKDEEFGQKCLSLYKGFKYIREKVDEFGVKDKTPGYLLALILGRVEMSDRISQYGAGDQGFLEQVLSIYDSSAGTEKKKEQEVIKRFPRALGQWLYTSLLRFPGILLTEGSCEAYLGIENGSLSKLDIRKLFNSAVYSGPFSELGPYFWRDKIDEMLVGSNTEFGIDFIKSKLGKAKARIVRSNVCQQEGVPAHPATFMCMMNEKPVCKEHSRGGISWFPAGADLARISLSEYRKIGPFVGLY